MFSPVFTEAIAIATIVTGLCLRKNSVLGDAWWIVLVEHRRKVMLNSSIFS